ncbi:hypothetical protein GEMRC1_008839 [Eukaryota sp. GEM-RC1]
MLPFPVEPTDSLFAITFFIAVYGLILSKGSQILANGTEKLTLVLPPAFVGGFLVPVLGALPDIAIIVFTLIDLDASDVRKEGSIAMGLIAGSSSMLLILAFSLTIFLGRCDFQHDFLTGRKTTVDNECNSLSWRSLLSQGIELNKEVSVSAKWLLLSSLAYPFIAISTWIYSHQNVPEEEIFDSTKWYIVATTAFVSILFFIYLFICAFSKQTTKFSLSLKERLLVSKVISKLQPSIKTVREPFSERERLNTSDVALEIGQKWRERVQKKKNVVFGSVTNDQCSITISRCKTFSLGFGGILAGVSIVILFSDVMVECMGNFAAYFDISPFFVSFCVGPLAANISEVIMTAVFASQKTKNSISLGVSSLLGAGVITNTLVFGCLLVLLYFKKVAFIFYSETIIVFSVQIVISCIVLSLRLFNLSLGILLIWLYPLCLGLFYVLHYMYKI